MSEKITKTSSASGQGINKICVKYFCRCLYSLKKKVTCALRERVRTGKLNFEVSDIPSMANKISLRPPPPWENFLDRAIEDCVLLFDKDKFKTKKKKLKPQLG